MGNYVAFIMEGNMDFLTFLNTMLNSLNTIEVRGKENIDTLYGCIVATESMRNSLISLGTAEQKDEQPKGGDVDG